MELGMIGLGRMGAGMTERLLRAGHAVVGYDVGVEAMEKIREKGAATASSIQDLVGRLAAPRVVWMMVPSGETVDRTLEALFPSLSAGDVIVDGGNSYYKDTVRRGAAARTHGLFLVDVGTSGGVWGSNEGYSLMVGGEPAATGRLGPLFEALAPSADRGWGVVGPSGAGHFVKMIHNGIEYGLMQAYGEGFALLKHKAEFNLDLHQVAEIWRYGSVVRSWLLDLVSRALRENAGLKGVAAYVADSGEGRWTLQESLELNVPAPVIALSLIERLASRDTEGFSNKLLAALRQQFGGHSVKRDA
jgi:6-phosphogluconate dehydrogenase